MKLTVDEILLITALLLALLIGAVTKHCRDVQRSRRLTPEESAAAQTTPRTATPPARREADMTERED